MEKTKNFEKLIVVGDKVLIKPKTLSNKTKTGLFLPPGYSEKEEIQSGYVIKSGPGFPIPSSADEAEEMWKTAGKETTRYIPLQARAGDLAIFLAKGAVEIVYDNEKYFVVSQYSILLLERDETLFE